MDYPSTDEREAWLLLYEHITKKPLRDKRCYQILLHKQDSTLVEIFNE